jgi:polysaccharide biosynthesis PFTS motif protein
MLLLNNKKEIVKSFFKIRHNNKIFILFSIKKKLENKLLKFKINEDFKFDINKSYSQFLYQNLIQYNHNFNIKLINSLAFDSTFYFYLPKVWLVEISKSGIKVNFILSKILWIIYCLKIFLKFNIKIYFLVIFSFFMSNNKQSIYFNDPSFHVTKKSKKNFFPDFITFVSLIINKPVEEIISKYSFVFSYNNLIKNLSILNKLYLLIYLNFFFLKINFFGIFKNINLYNFSEELFFYNFFNKKKDLLPKYVFYSNSNFLYKPLWTYVKNSNLEDKVYMFFYSDNFIPIKFKSKNVKSKFNNLNNILGLKLLSWQKFIFWNKKQFLWFKKMTNKKIDFIISPYKYIPFEGINVILKKRKNTLSIFDVHPMNMYNYSVSSDPKNIYTFSYCKKFLDDIVLLQNKYNFNLIIKSKFRNMNFNVFSKRYYEYLQSLKSKKIQIFNSNISAMSIIKVSDAVVSIPFSSPTLLAYAIKKKSCYYDPKSIILNNSNRTKKIKLISSQKNLDNWIYKNLVE